MTDAEQAIVDYNIMIEALSAAIDQVGTAVVDQSESAGPHRTRAQSFAQVLPGHILGWLMTLTRERDALEPIGSRNGGLLT